MFRINLLKKSAAVIFSAIVLTTTALFADINTAMAADTTVQAGQSVQPDAGSQNTKNWPEAPKYIQEVPFLLTLIPVLFFMKRTLTKKAFLQVQRKFLQVF